MQERLCIMAGPHSSLRQADDAGGSHRDHGNSRKGRIFVPDQKRDRAFREINSLTGNPEQQKAIMHGAGPMMVLAGPGSGKTFVLTRRIVHLINEHHIPPSEILVITFTRAAAAEMQKRFLALCEGTHPPVTFGTFHAVFYSILKESSICRSGSILSKPEKKKILQDIIRKNKYEISMHTDMLEEILAEIGRYKGLTGMDINNDINFVPKNIPPALFLQIYRDFREVQEILGKVDFDDMALKCEELFEKRPDILKQYQSRYRYLLIDEFQDIAPLQYRLVRQIAAPENNLFIVGDDDQSIYGFRGARPEIMLDFPKDFPEAETVTLSINYRSTPEVVQTAKRLITHNKKRFLKDSRAYNAHGRPVRREGYENTVSMETALLTHLLREKENGNLSECAVIARTSAQFPILAEKCRQAGIPCHFKEKVKSIYDSEIVSDLLAYLEFAHTPLKDRNRSQFFRFMNRPLRYISREAVNEQADFGHMMRYYQGRPAMQEEIMRLGKDLERIEKMPVFLAVNHIRKVMGYDRYLQEKSTGKVTERNTDESVNPLETADLLQNSAKGCKTLSQWKNVIEACRDNAGKNEIQYSTKQKAGAALMTMHASKGLEYDKVFILNCNEGTAPHRKAVSDEEIEEERRMFYVAMTRARKELTLLYITEEGSVQKESGMSGKKTPPSRFLNEIFEENKAHC